MTQKKLVRLQNLLVGKDFNSRDLMKQTFIYCLYIKRGVPRKPIAICFYSPCNFIFAYQTDFVALVYLEIDRKGEKQYNSAKVLSQQCNVHVS